jgi:hypothetical protein
MAKRKLRIPASCIMVVILKHRRNLEVRGKSAETREELIRGEGPRKGW